MKLKLSALSLAVAALGAASVSAQSLDDLKNQFKQFQREAQDEYDDFRQRANQEYADFMRRAWAQYELLDPVEKPQDDSVEPLVYEGNADDVEIDDGLSTNACVNYLSLDMYAPKPKPQPVPIAPIKEYPWPQQAKVDFDYYGTTCTVRYDDDQEFQLTSLDNDLLADTWLKMSGKEYNNTINDFLGLRNSLKLNDWAYFQMLFKFAKQVYGETADEATFLTAYLYAQSGYKMRLLRAGDHLGLLYSSAQTIFGKPRLREGEYWFYSIDDSFRGIEYMNMAFPNEQALELALIDEPKLNRNLSNVRTIQSERYPDMKVDVNVDKNLIDFFNDYPSFALSDNNLSRWAFYANTPLDTEVKKQLYPQIAQAIDGCTPRKAVAKILNFLQTGLTYKLDEEVWGYDRPFFAEETLFYPYCDCEDRAILFSHLVRDLVQPPVVLIYYPGHLAAAVDFGDDGPGDYVTVGDQRYTITDPTYTRAPVGRSMFAVSKATALLLD